MGRIAKFAFIVFGVIIFSGVIWGGIAVADRWLLQGELPPGKWWQWILAIPVIGIAALLIEGIGEVIGRAFGINQRGTPKWKEYLGIVTILVVGVAILRAFEWLR
ncbi:MAG: hypothetical protein AB7P08_04685 [Burkholderiales bacterium]